MEVNKDILRQTVYPVIGACQEVHKQLGPFLNEFHLPHVSLLTAGGHITNHYYLLTAIIKIIILDCLSAMLNAKSEVITKQKYN